jgi:hypothetical protein
VRVGEKGVRVGDKGTNIQIGRANDEVVERDALSHIREVRISQKKESTVNGDIQRGVVDIPPPSSRTGAAVSNGKEQNTVKIARIQSPSESPKSSLGDEDEVCL